MLATTTSRSTGILTQVQTLVSPIAQPIARWFRNLVVAPVAPAKRGGYLSASSTHWAKQRQTIDISMFAVACAKGDA